jgi:lysophospholipase L1-like esterase
MFMKKNLLVISVSFLGLFLLFACESQSLPADELDTVEISYLALGDSYTIGQGVADQSRWPNQLADSLRNMNVKVQDPKIIAQTGWTTRNLIEAINAQSLMTYDLVSLLIGVNNQYQNRSFDEFKIEFEELLQTALNLSTDTKQVFVVSIPDYGVTPFGSANAEIIAEQLDMYNQYMEDVCDGESVLFINITDISRELGDQSGALANDQLHPSGEQYSKWVDRMLPFVVELIK